MAVARAQAHCVTRAEFQQVPKGATRKQVEHVFDTRGEMGDGGAGWYVRTYDRCGTGHKPVSVTYTISRAHPVAHLYRKVWGRPPAAGAGAGSVPV
ncbi:MAG: hypothetical protein ACXVXB_02435 [Nocardioidaceae bacterium]